MAFIARLRYRGLSRRNAFDKSRIDAFTLPIITRRLFTADIAPTKSRLAKYTSQFRRVTGLLSFGVFFSGAGFVFATLPAFKIANEFLNPPTDDETLSLFIPDDDETRSIEDFINNHSLTQEMRSRSEYSESRPYFRIPKSHRTNNLTAGILTGPDMIVVPPLCWIDRDGNSLVSILYLGKNLCGYPDLVHGGLLATILDESLARCCFTALPNKVGMTANLNINYRKPAPAGTCVVIRAKVNKVVGRKAWVEGCVQTLPIAHEEPVVLAEASGLFIEPRKAATMAKVYPV